MVNIEKHPVDSLSIDCESLMISLKAVPFNKNIMSRLLDDLAAAGVNVDVISRTAPVGETFDVSLLVPERDMASVREIANDLGSDFKMIGITVNKNGIGMRTQSGVAARYLQVFADNDIQVMMVTTSEICISCIVRNEDAKKAATAIQAAFQLQ